MVRDGGGKVLVTYAKLLLKGLGQPPILSFSSLGLECKVNMRRKCHRFRELTVGIRFTRDGWTVHPRSESISPRSRLQYSRSRAAPCFSKTSAARRVSDLASSNLLWSYKNLPCSFIAQPKWYG